MKFRALPLVLALSLVSAGIPAAAGSPDTPERLVAPPESGPRADGYWSVDRMDRATVVRPIVLDPETMRPVPLAVS